MNNKDLNKDYEILDYLEIKLEPTIKISGFRSEEEAKRRINILKKDNPSLEGKIYPRYGTTIIDYVVEVPEFVMSYLNSEEKTRIIEDSQYIQVIASLPIVYREMDEKYIDSFFETGELMISTYQRCQSLENNERKDRNELRNKIISIDGQFRAEVDMQLNPNAFLLCASLSNCFSKTENRYCLEIDSIDDCIRIITKALLAEGYKVVRVLYGPCFYSDKQLSGDVDANLVKNIIEAQDREGTSHVTEILNMSKGIAGDKMFFNKGLSFSHEMEFRIVWLLKEEFNKDMIVLRVPELKPYCKKALIV